MEHLLCLDRIKPRRIWLSRFRPGIVQVLPIPSYVTVNFPELVAVPPGVVTVIGPVFAPLGTLTVIFV